MRPVRSAPLIFLVFGAVLVCGGQAHAQSYSSDDFDLSAVVGLMSSTGRGAASDMAALEQLMNDPANGINNVDVDADGLVDYVGCYEVRRRSRRMIVFLAHLSSSQGRLSSAVATVVVRHDRQRQLIRLEASRVTNDGRDLGDAHEVSIRYSHGFAEHLFLDWLLRTRSIYQPVRDPYRFYQPHARLTATEAERRRAEFQRRLRQPPIAPIPAELIR